MTVAAILTLLIFINALYVAAEFGAVSVRRSRIQQRAEEGDRLASSMLPILSDPAGLDRYIAACQIGITVSSLVLGAYGQAALAPRLRPLFQDISGMQEIAAQSASAVVVLISLTVVQMILGELVPKSLALQFPTAVTRYTVVPMRVSLRLLAWLIVVLNGSGLALLRLLGVRDAAHRHVHAPEEIEYLIAESRSGGYLRPAEHQRLRDALHLTSRRVAEVMVPRTQIQGVKVDTPFTELLRITTDSPFTRLPVYGESLDDIVGILHFKDVAAMRLSGEPRDLREVLYPVIAVPETMTLERSLARLREKKQHVAVVVDDFGGTAGLVTIGDILDEIFGGIVDEFKMTEPEIETLPDGRIRLPGRLSLKDAEHWTGVLWSGESYTVGGLVIDVLGRLPEVGETLEIERMPVQVERLRGRAIESILVEPARRREDRRG